jgi:hypothetical protein
MPSRSLGLPSDGLLQRSDGEVEARIKELVANLPDLAVLVEPLLTVRRVLREHPAPPLAGHRLGR